MAFSAHDVVPDSPTNTFATMNPLSKDGGTTLSNGNLDLSSTDYGNNTATFFLTSGKWYWEGSGVGYVAAICGKAGQNWGTSISATGSNSIGWWWENGSVYWDGGNNGGSTTYSSSDVVGTALDMDSGVVYFYKNGTLTYTITFGSGTIPDLSDGVFPCYNNGNLSGTKTATYNFGQDPTFGETKPVGNYAFNTAKIYSTFGGTERSANYTVEYSDDNSNWTTAWTGVMSNNTATGIQQGTGGGGSYGTHKYWRYVEGSAVVGHHPRTSRIILSDGTNDTNLIVYSYDNSSDVGAYLIGTVAREISEGYTDANGIGSFFYEPPTGALALCTANLPDPDIDPNVDDLPEDYMKAVKYVGDYSSPATIPVGFNPDLVWIKQRTPYAGQSHCLYDSVRGVSKRLYSDSTSQEITPDGNGGVTNFSDNNGFELTRPTNAAYEGFDSSQQMIAWCWKAGGAPSATDDGTGVSGSAKLVNTSGTASSTTCKSFKDAAVTAGASNVICPSKMSINQKAGFSIIKYTGNNTNGATIPHGLMKAPELIILKNLTASPAGYALNWLVWHKSIDQIGYLNTTDTFSGGSRLTTVFGSSSGNKPTDNVIYTGYTASNVNDSNMSYIYYLFHSVAGYSKFGSYVGTSTTDGTFVYCGFKPAWVMIKAITEQAQSNQPFASWFIADSARSLYNPSGGDNTLWANRNAAEGKRGDGSTANTSVYLDIDFLSNGFKLRNGAVVETNRSDTTYIYAAFAEQPFKYANAR